ncbi:alpha-amylase family glycosyl hydrolase [Natrinema salsiterrestre]|uniref:Alpha-amylase family glycosyl hydrolase n=1 Tax=Natrinema salsiterrestre TaxID=2950540 RepID=A0A9Q4L4X1_9EURY|nr:alpha-amylase family glycosyl hydrolase [Natrinema salsiterrestre]MDF9746908.1 alpha-amylase family glycosyl hydrolase [Natrinema salsiterrestre]
MDWRRLRTDGGETEFKTSFESGDGSSHPGPPRFVTVGEGIVDPNGNEMETRDSLAPWNPDSDTTYDWRVLESPPGSTAVPTDGPVAEFEPDVPGEYTLGLEAPDGTHELTVRAFPEADDDAPRPQVELDATVEDGRVSLSATASVVGTGDPDIEFYVDDRHGDVLEADGTIPVSATDEPTRVYAVAVDERHSVPDAVELVPASEGTDTQSVAIEYPFEPPEWAVDAIVYEIFTRRFPDQDDPTFETIADRLDHLEDLGIDVLWLTPFLAAESGFGTPMEAGGPHGYNTTDYFRVDPDLGTMADFEALVDACHERGIRVVFDLVINHTAETHPFYEAAVDESHPDHERYRDWYRWVDFDERDADTYFGWDGIPNLNYANPAVREYLLGVVDFWAGRVDGFRADVAWGVPLSFWTEVSDRLTGRDSDFFLLDETLPSDTEMGGGRFHMHHDDVLHDTLEQLGESVAGDGTDESDETGRKDEEDAVADEFTDSAAGLDTTTADAILEAIEDRQRRGAHPDSEWLLYVENHDTDRYLAEYGRDAQLAAGAATLTLPGSPMLYYGQETGVTGRRDPMNWGAFDEDLLEHYERLIDLRKSHPALQAGADLERIPYEADTAAAVAFARTDSETDRRVVVVLHFGTGTATVELEESVGETDLLIGTDGLEWERTVAVDSVAVLDADGDGHVDGSRTLE